MVPRHNMQIHSVLSNCASREMTLARIIEEAEQAGLETIGISDHIDHPNPARQEALLANFGLVEQLRPSIDVRVGCEASQIQPHTIAVDRETARQLDFVLVATNHYHLRHVENPHDTSPAGYAAHYLRMVEGAIDWGHTTIIPHPFLLAKVRNLDLQQVLASYNRDELRRILQKAAHKHVAFELNPRHLRAAMPFFEELIALGRQVGLQFALGTDAHKPHEIAYSQADVETLNQLGVCDADLMVGVSV